MGQGYQRPILVQPKDGTHDMPLFRIRIRHLEEARRCLVQLIGGLDRPAGPGGGGRGGQGRAGGGRDSIGRRLGRGRQRRCGGEERPGRDNLLLGFVPLEKEILGKVERVQALIDAPSARGKVSSTTRSGREAGPVGLGRVKLTSDPALEQHAQTGLVSSHLGRKGRPRERQPVSLGSPAGGGQRGEGGKCELASPLLASSCIQRNPSASASVRQPF